MKIKADLRFLIAEQEVSYFADKYFVGTTAVVVDNSSNFSTNDFILIGQLGTETAEIKKISSVAGTTLNLATALTYDHPQDDSVINIGYDSINFFYSSTVTGGLTALNGSPQTITPDGIFNSYNDTVHTTGYGWFRFYNSVALTSSSLSNAVPYAGWAENSVKVMIDRFYHQIGNREKKLIKDEDVIGWLNEAYAIARNRLNLVNREYTVPTPQTISILSGTAEYDLPSGFAHTRVVSKADGTPILFISYDEVPGYVAQAASGGTTITRYYIRGTVIGFTPSPTASATYYHYYQTVSPVLASYIDYIDLPNNNHYFLLDYLLYRASPIIGGDAMGRLKVFQGGLDGLVVSSHKRDDEPSSFGVDSHAIV